jgi:hypothetical protein
MAINESVQGILIERSWKQRTLVEVAEAGQLFTISEAEFDRVLAHSQIDEGVQEWIKKAKEFAAKLPADLKQAQQYVVKQTGKALDASNTAYVKAQNLINKIPLIGRIPEQTRNRLLLGLALSFAVGMGQDASAGETGGDAGSTDTTPAPAAGDATTTPAPAPAPAPAAGDAAAATPDVQTFGNPDPKAMEIGHGTEGNKVVADLMKGNTNGKLGASMLREKFHAAVDQMAAGNVKGAKMAATSLTDSMGATPEMKQQVMQILMKVGQTAKANGVKMR